MNQEQYNEFTDKLQKNLMADNRVIGLVALGSMAARDYLPDRWSDHDFFVIVESGYQEGYRTDLGWLPGSHEIVLSIRETEHGLKVLYRDGHLLEFAIFDMVELNLAKVNRYRVLFDRANVTGKLAELAQTSQRESASQNQNDLSIFGQFLANLLVGAGRYYRGEKLSGHQFIKSYALRHLLVLLEKYHPSPDHSILDNLDPFRRFERAYPETGAQFASLLLLEPPAAALAMLDLATRELGPILPDFPAEAVEVVTRFIREV